MSSWLSNAAVAFCVAQMLFGGAAKADNSKCWGITGDDKTRPDISCHPLTEEFLVGLEGVTEAQVLKSMNAPGVRPGGDDITLHYMTAAKHGMNGDVNFKIENGVVTLILALIDPTEDGGPFRHFVWNGAMNYECSEFPGTKDRDCE